MVAVQLNILIAEGMATKNVRNENSMVLYSLSAVVNMWCPHTRKPSTAMAMDEKAMNL